ncbi:Dicarboxylate/amino acid:cation (Na or H) symporter (DAACS) family protein, partial [Phytophthora palmivora]
MPMDVFANAVVRPPAPIVLLDEEQQRIIRDGQNQQIPEQLDDPQQERTDSTGNIGLFVPTTPPMLPIPQHVTPQAPPPPTTNYLRTDFTTGRRPTSTTTTNTQKSLGDGIRTNFTTNRQNPNPVAAFMKENAPDNSLSNSLSAPTDYGNVEPTAMPFISSTDPPEEVRPDPTKGFRGNRSNLKLSVRYMIIGAIVGIALGVVFAHVGVSDIAAQWISLPGDLFLRAVNALVVPYVFCSVAVAVGDIVFVGKVSIVGLQTLKIFATGWVVSTLLGISVAFIFRPLFRLKNKYASPDANAVGLTCSNGLMVEMLSNNSITCSSNATELSLDNAFVLEDVNNVFETNSDAVITDLTLSKQLISTLESVVPDNIFASLADGDLLAIITFAMVLGSIA